MGKYRTPGSEAALLPNLLGLTDATALGLAEFEGFLRAEIMLSDALDEATFPRYVAAVQQSGLGNYAPMRQLMRALYPG